jgi:hypothetical protein
VDCGDKSVDNVWIIQQNYNTVNTLGLWINNTEKEGQPVDNL